MATATVKIGKKGTFVIPVEIRERMGIEEGSLMILEEQDGKLVLRPAVAIPVEIYTMRRKAELLLANAVDENDYARIVAEVKRMGFDPADIPHERPGPGNAQDAPPVS